MDWQFKFDEIVDLDEEQLKVLFAEFTHDDLIHILKMILNLTKTYEATIKSGDKIIKLYDEKEKQEKALHLIERLIR